MERNQEGVRYPNLIQADEDLWRCLFRYGGRCFIGDNIVYFIAEKGTLSITQIASNSNCEGRACSLDRSSSRIVEKQLWRLTVKKVNFFDIKMTG